MKNKLRVPSQNRGMQTREKIIIAGLELFSERGYHSTNSKEIAARADASIGSFYAYFKDKRELFIEAFRYYAHLIENELFLTVNTGESADDDLNVWGNLIKDFTVCKDNGEKLKIIITNLIKTHNYYPGFSREITVMRLLDTDIKKIIDDHEKSDIKNLTDVIKLISADIRIRDAEVAAYIIFRSLETIIHETRFKPEMADKQDRIINEMTDMIYRYIFEN